MYLDICILDICLIYHESSMFFRIHLKNFAPGYLDGLLLLDSRYLPYVLTFVCLSSYIVLIFIKSMFIYSIICFCICILHLTMQLLLFNYDFRND
jgi:hypothetical protein